MHEEIQRLNALAKALRDTGLAKTSDEAFRMATEMRQEALRDIQEIKETEEVDLDSKDLAREIVQEGEQILTRIPLEYEKEKDEIEHLEEEVVEEKELEEETMPSHEEELKREIEFLRNEQNDFLISSIKEKIEDVKKAREEGDEERAKQELSALKEQMSLLQSMKKGSATA